MDTAEVALRVSMVSAAFSLGSLVWNMSLYRLSGARVEVLLRVARLDLYGNLYRHKKLDPKLPSTISEYGTDLALIRVTNIGRVAISVTEISLDVGRWGRSWHHHTLAGRPVAVHGTSETDRGRLEPGSTIEVLYDFWSLVETAREDRGDPAATLHVRASATPAGRRTRRSPWRSRLKIEPSRDSLWSAQPATPAQRAYEQTWRLVRVTDTDRQFAACVNVLELVEHDPEPTEAQIHQALVDAQVEAYPWMAREIFAAFKGREPAPISSAAESAQSAATP